MHEDAGSEQGLDVRAVFLFWLPLAITWVMMATEQPIANGFIARLSFPEHNLAAFGVAITLGYLFESPLYQIISAASALADSKDAYIKLRNFTFAISGLIALLFLVALSPAVFPAISRDVLNLEPQVAQLTRDAVIFLLPAPFFVAYRRLYQGVLIRNDSSKKIAIATILRMAVMALACGLLFCCSSLDGASVGAAGRAIALFTEAFTIRLMTEKTLRHLPDSGKVGSKALTYPGLIRFYLPLSLTAVILFLNYPILTFFMARSRDPLLSLAAFPVVNGIMFFFFAMGMALHETVIAKIGDRHEEFKPLLKFGFCLGVVITVSALLIAYTPIAELCFVRLYGLGSELTEFCLLPVQIACFVPIVSLFSIWQRAVLTRGRTTFPIGLGSASDVLALTIWCFVAARIFEVPGAQAAFSAVVVGRVVSVLVMLPYYRGLKRGYRALSPVKIA